MSHHHSHLSEAADRTLPEFNTLQKVKRRFFAMRNGALGAQMRGAGLDYRVNFGLNIMQVKEIAAEIAGGEWGLSSHELVELATTLWENENTRESRLLAPMIFPADIMSMELAARWLAQAQNPEIVDHLCHSLLRRLPFAGDLWRIAIDNATTDLQRYGAMRLLLNLLIIGKGDRVAGAEAARAEFERDVPLTKALAARVLEEIEAWD